MKYNKDFVFGFAVYYHENATENTPDELKRLFESFFEVRTNNVDIRRNTTGYLKDKIHQELKAKAEEVLDYACVVCMIDSDELKTGCRERGLADARKIISRTLYDIGYTEQNISDLLRPYVGTRDTVHAQIEASRFWNKTFNHELVLMLSEVKRKFC